ncbi:NAD(P)H-dependent FMN reductase ntnL [Cladobotryum mycophilum]|uniref:NAD(P)H-dependent FMN reductase ntnL n=1 Tax=Cladobotryum mycophilum TaxID=491253 RepID=A0ABR0SEJ7_9HYPO
MLFNVAIIITSVRTPRIGPHVATLIKSILQKDPNPSINLSIVDLADFKLPIFDESIVPGNIPAYGSFSNPHSIAWSDEIKKYDAYVLTLPEYNYGVAGSTKNAIDYLKHEWDGKPVALVGYGIYGAKNATASVKTSLSGMGLRVVDTGKLGEASQKEWEEQGAVLVKALKEIQDGLENPP